MSQLLSSPSRATTRQAFELRLHESPQLEDTYIEIVDSCGMLIATTRIATFSAYDGLAVQIWHKYATPPPPSAYPYLLAAEQQLSAHIDKQMLANDRKVARIERFQTIWE